MNDDIRISLKEASAAYPDEYRAALSQVADYERHHGHAEPLYVRLALDRGEMSLILHARPDAFDLPSLDGTLGFPTPLGACSSHEALH